VLIGAPRDADRMDAIGRASGVSVAHTARAREMMAIIATSDLVFTVDTAVIHIASAFDKPILAMFARGKAGLWGPYDIPGVVVSTPAGSIDSLDVASVLPALVEVVEIATPTRRSLPAPWGNLRSLQTPELAGAVISATGAACAPHRSMTELSAQPQAPGAECGS
jgi:hypothetical protein